MIDTLVGLSLRKKKIALSESTGIARPELSKCIDNDFANSRNRRRGESYTVRVSGCVAGQVYQNHVSHHIRGTCATDFWHVSIIDFPLEISARDMRAHYLYLAPRATTFLPLLSREVLPRDYVRRKT